MYDFLFYWIHLLFHKYGFHFHKEHHGWEGTLRVAETLRHSLVDAFAQVSINIFIQNLFNKHPLTRISHNILISYILTEIHSGYDFPFFSHNIFPSIFGGSIRHNIHHQRGDVYFHQFFKYLDNQLDYIPSSSSKREMP